MRSFLEGYLNKLVNIFDSAIQKGGKEVKVEMAALPLHATENEFIAAAWTGLIKNWNFNFEAPVDKVVDKTVQTMYSYYRKDKRPFREGIGFERVAEQSFFDIPDAVFDLIDTRAIEFLKSVDSFWLGKFINDPDTERRITDWLKDQFESGNVPVGPDNPLVDSFIHAFSDIVRLEAWKIRRIIETTANRTRNFGNLNYINQAQVQKFEIVEVNDSRTCPWCKHMNGKIMSVTTAVTSMNELVNDGFDRMPELTPFATTVKIEDFKKLDAVSLQLAGFSTPPYHPHCRGRIVADFS